MADVFISYSRHNIEFARRLFDAIQKGGRDSWVDWDDIPMSAEWFKAIQEGIEGANGFIFIITPESLASAVCTLEVAHAIATHKRIIPIMHVDSPITDAYARLAAFTPTGFMQETLAGRDLLELSRKNWSVLEGINWISFRDADDFDTGIRQLISVVETDYERVRLHTRLLVRANEWNEKGYDKSYLLVGTDLRDAASWLKVDGDKPPVATEQHKVFIRASLHQEEEENAARAGQIVALNEASQRAATESARAERQSRRAGLATVVAGVLVALLIGAALIAQSQITDANARVGTATIDQGNALFGMATATALQGQAEQRAVAADTRVAVAGDTLTPIPGTLTQAAALRQDALDSQTILNEFSNVLLNLNTNVGNQISRMDSLIARYPESPVAYRARGNVLTIVGEYERAAEDYTRAVELDPAYADAHLSLGNVHYFLGDYLAALGDFTTVLSLNPANAVAHYNRGLVFSMLEQFDRAIEDYSGAIGIDPLYTEAYNNRGVAHFALEQYQEAVDDYTRAIEIGPASERIYANLNLALAALNQPTRDLRTLFPSTPTPAITATAGEFGIDSGATVTPAFNALTTSGSGTPGRSGRGAANTGMTMATQPAPEATPIPFMDEPTSASFPIFPATQPASPP